jgi:hypothetical protein
MNEHNPIVSNCKVEFYHGNPFSKEGLEEKPFAVLTMEHSSFVDFETVHSMALKLREYINSTQGDFCNFRFTFDDYDS